MTCEGLGKRLRDIEAATGGGGTPIEVCSSFSIETNSNVFEDAFEFPVADGHAIKAYLETVAVYDDGTGRAAFERTGLFFRNGGSVEIQDGFWHTVFTAKSSGNFDVRSLVGPTSVKIQIKSPISGTVKWRGRVCLIEVPA